MEWDLVELLPELAELLHLISFYWFVYLHYSQFTLVFLCIEAKINLSWIKRSLISLPWYIHKKIDTNL